MSLKKWTKQPRLWRKKPRLPKRRVSNSRSSTDRPIPVLHAFSPSVISEPADWPETAKSTGYWFLDEPILEWSPSPELLQFLANDSPPIYVGFGSIFGRDAMTTTKIVVDAITQAEVRAVVATGWGGLNITNIELPENVLAIESAPHDWLFPQVAAVVHHGGCGTTAAGLRAGKPTVICPFFGDQPFWGDIVHRLGVGPLPIPQKKLTAEKLSLAIRAAVNDEAIRSSSEAIGRQIRDEDGVAEAVAFIERLFQ